jgi:general secretion pathway protein I
MSTNSRFSARRDVPRGFSLLELLVAFTIFATLLGVLLQVFSAGLRTAHSGERDTRAVVIAQSLLDTLGVEQPLRVGIYSGTTDDAYHWRITVRPYVDDQLPVTNRVLIPLTVNVDVFWEEDDTPRGVSLMSILLGPRPP